MTVSLWSVVRWDGDLRHDADARGEGSPAARERDRVELFERLSAESVASPEKAAANAAAMRAERERRAGWWGRQLRLRGVEGLELFGHTMAVLEISLWVSVPMVVSTLWWLFTAGLFLLQKQSGSQPSLLTYGLHFFIALGISAFIITMFVRRGQRELRLARSLKNGTCANCGAACGVTDGEPSGPSACAGCGVAWPAVASPIPAAAAAAFAPASAVKTWAEGDRPVADAPALGPRITQWDRAALALSNEGLLGLRLEQRERWGRIRLPRFGRRRSLWLSINLVGFLVVAVLFVVVLWLQSGLGPPLIMLGVGVCVVAGLFVQPDRWKFGAVRRARCMPFQRALASDVACPELAKQLRERRSTRAAVIIEARIKKQGWRLVSTASRAVALTPLVLWFGYLGVDTLLRSGGGRGAMLGMFAASFPILIVVILVFVVWFQRQQRRQRHQLLASFGAKRCCDCNYDLSGIPDAIDPERLGGEQTGPARCPECEAPWPLVPPVVT
ncbi:MAG: hypothetical protein ACKVZJ_01450 [Phycisphaerales bacterium]